MERVVHFHCVKSVQIRSFFWSVFSRVRTECREILRISLSLLIQSEYGKIRTRKKLRIWTLFMQCLDLDFLILSNNNVWASWCVLLAWKNYVHSHCLTRVQYVSNCTLSIATYNFWQFLVTNSRIWLVNILRRNFDTLSKKEKNMKKTQILWWKTTTRKSKKSMFTHKAASFILNSPHWPVM